MVQSCLETVNLAYLLGQFYTTVIHSEKFVSAMSNSTVNTQVALLNNLVSAA